MLVVRELGGIKGLGVEGVGTGAWRDRKRKQE